MTVTLLRLQSRRRLKILFDLAGDALFFVELALGGAVVGRESLLKSIIGMAPLIEWRCPETSA